MWPPAEPLKQGNLITLAERPPLSLFGAPIPQGDDNFVEGTASSPADVAAMATMRQQGLSTGNQLSLLSGDQRKPVVMEHCCAWYRQSLLQQSPIRQHCAASERVVLSKLNQAGCIASAAMPFPESVLKLSSLSINQRGIGMK